MSETLTQALCRHGISHSQSPSRHYARQLCLSGEAVGEPIDSETGWLLVKMLDHNGSQDREGLCEYIRDAIEAAAGKTPLCENCLTGPDGCYCALGG